MPMEGGLLGGKSVSSPPPPNNPYSGPSTTDKPSKIREELTSSSEEVPPTSPGAPSTLTSIAASSKTNAISIVDTQGVKSGIILSGKSHAQYVGIHSRVTTPPVTQRSNSRKCKVPIKSTRSVWKASQGSNLIISFSDDSGSDSESQRLQKAPVTSCANTNESKRLAPVPGARLESAPQPLRKDGQDSTKKLSISQAPSLSITKPSARKPRTVRSSSVEPKYFSTHSSSMGNSIANKDLGHYKGGLSDNKLQDLRQQIATRENELKLKAVQTVQHNKASYPDSYRESGDLKHNSTVTRVRSIGPDLPLEPKEPAAKRVRLGSKNFGQSFPTIQDDTSLKFIVPSNELLLNSDENQVAATVHHKQGKVNADSMSFPNSFGVHSVERRCESSLKASNTRRELRDNCFTGSRTLSKSTALSASVSSDKPSEPPSADRLDTNDRLCYAFNQAKLGDEASRSHLQAIPGQAVKGQDLVSHPDCNATLLSIIEAEEMHDKQLEEAQEHRRRCEIEERNALRAYREAQRALTKANAQCAYFYRMRELSSARVHTSMMEDSNLLSSNQYEQFGPRWNVCSNVSRDSVDPCMTLVGDMHTVLDASNQICYDSHVQSAEAETQNSPNGRLKLGLEPLSEPDSSTSELLPQKDNGAGLLSPSSDLNVSSDEYELISLQEQQYGGSSLKFQKDRSQQRKLENMSDNSAPISSHEESIKREAQLRSELFSRLRKSASLTKSMSGSSGCRIDKVAEVDVLSGKQKMSSPNDYVGPAGDHMLMAVEKDGVDNINIRTQFSEDNALHSNQKQDCLSDIGGSEVPSGILSKIPPVEQNSVISLPDITAILKDRSVQSIGSSNYLFRSAFLQLKLSRPKVPNHVQSQIQHDSSSSKSHYDMTPDDVGECLLGGIDSYSCNSVIDPLWPLCMHELRGKCNDEECPYQHTRECPSMHQRSGSEAGLTAIGEKLIGASLISTPPAYIVCFNGLDFSSPHFDPLHSQTFKGTGIFSISLAVSSSLLKNVSADEPVLHGNLGCDEACASYWKSLYIQNRSHSMTVPDDYTQLLETALTILCEDVDSSEGKKKSLSMLTQSLEDDPTCPHIWVLYLLIYYSYKNKAEDEDFFSCAVKHNEGSYELWLLYINSRRHLKDRDAAYERSIFTLCHKSPSENVGCHSAFILDLFLQMLHSCIISGNVGRAIKRISALSIDEKDSDSVLLSDVLQCLVVSDKYLFWVSCVYLVIYRKLPDTVVQWFEFEKDITLTDWPIVKIDKEQKELVYKLIDMASDLFLPPADLDDKTAVEAAQRFALSHVKLVEAFDGLESSKKLLEKYTTQYPSCLELVLLLARHRCNDDGGQRGFEEALTKWPREVPGIQCIWNQYVEYVFRTEGHDAAKDVLVCWSGSFAKDPSAENVFEDDINESILSMYASGSRPAKLDLIYGLLNLSVYRLMHDDVVRAQVAVDEAIKSGVGADLSHCIRELSVFWLNYGTQAGKEVSTGGVMEFLSGYMDSIDLPLKESLSRKFIQQIQAPRARLLFEGILCSFSPDVSVLNLILESLFGPSLLPQELDRTKDLVDLVEKVLDISPANYLLAISACKILLQPKVVCASTSFWASSILVSTIFRSFPIPPEYAWVEAAGLLGMLKGTGEAVRERFYQKALSVYPYSVGLWKAYVCSLGEESRTDVLEAARKKGIESAILLGDEIH